MAEIKIEKKTPIWPWILVALAIIAIIIYIVASTDDNEENDNSRDQRQEQRMDETSYVAPDHSRVISLFNETREHSYQVV